MPSSLHAWALAAGAFIATAASAPVVIPATCSSTGSCVEAIRAAVASCAGQASCAIVLQAGTYNITGPAYSPVFQFSNVPGLSITGAGPDATVLLMQDIYSLFNIGACDDLVLSEFSVDNSRLPFTLGVVQSVNAGVSTLTFNATEYPVDLARYSWLGSAQVRDQKLALHVRCTEPSSSHLQAAIQYNLSSGRLARGGVDDYWLPPNNRPLTYISTSGPDAAFTVPASFPIGAALIVRHQACGRFFRGLACCYW